MIRAGSGLAADAETAARRALAAAGGKADATIVFATEPSAIEAVREVTGAAALIGCTGAGVLTEEREIEGEPAVAVLVLSGVEAAAAAREDGGESAGFSLARGFVERKPRVVVALPSPMTFDADAFFRGFQDVAGSLPIVGGVAGASMAELSALALAGPFALETIVSHCATPLGPARLIMESEGHRILRLDGGTPLDILTEVLSSLPSGERKMALRGLLAGVAPIVRKPDLERGDFVIRNLVEVDQETGAVGVPCRVAVGMKFAFHRRDAAGAEEDFRARLARAKDRLAGRRIAFGLYFNCMGRGRGLYGRESVDVALIREGLGTFPLAGFHGNGELAPLGGENLLHNYTGVLALFLTTESRSSP